MMGVREYIKDTIKGKVLLLSRVFDSRKIRITETIEKKKFIYKIAIGEYPNIEKKK